MKIALFENDVNTRSVIYEELRSFGCAVAPFGDARLALLFLLGHLEELDGVVVNVDEPGQGAWLLRRLEFVPAPLAIVTYSSHGPKSGARIHRLLRMSETRGTRERPINRTLSNSAGFRVNSRRTRQYVEKSDSKSKGTEVERMGTRVLRGAVPGATC